MIKNLMRFIGFWVLFSLLFSALNMATSLEEKRWKEFYNLPRDSIDVIFIGNSHNYVAFQPQIIDDIVPVRSYVIGGGGENVVLSYYELREVLRYQHPKMVVLETFTLDLDDEFMPTQNYYGFLDSGRWSVNRTSVALRYLTPEKLYTIFPSLRTRMDIQKINLYTTKLIETIQFSFLPTIDPGSGAAPQEEVISENDYLLAETATVTEFPQAPAENEQYLDKIRQLCLENDIQLVLSKVPMVSQPQITTGRYAPFDVEEYAAEHKIPLMIFNPGLFNYLHYAEFAHINKFGSMIVSTQMAQQIAGSLDLLIDQNALEYYESFIFSDYSVTNENDHYTFQLFPAVENPLLEYKWSVVGLLDRQVVYDSDWSKENSIQFDLTQSGVYEVDLAVRNSTGEYELTAVFQLTKED